MIRIRCERTGILSSFNFRSVHIWNRNDRMRCRTARCVVFAFRHNMTHNVIVPQPTR